MLTVGYEKHYAEGPSSLWDTPEKEIYPLSQHVFGRVSHWAAHLFVAANGRFEGESEV